MRIIAGEKRGSNIQAPPAGTRPTPDKVREAVFGILQTHIPGASVLDGFAGSGAMGLEALSRGAASATFIDNARAAIATIRQNAAKLKLEDNVRIIQSDFGRALRSLAGRGFDVVFLDPPFDAGLLDKAVELLFSLDLVAEGGVVCAEHPARQSVAPDLQLARDQRRYGAVGITLFRKGGVDE